MSARRKNNGFGKIISTVLVLAILAGAGYVFVPRLCHECDNCGEFFVGTGYYPNIISSAITSITGEEEKIICEDCAAKEHALAIAAGQSINDFKRPLFETEDEGK